MIIIIVLLIVALALVVAGYFSFSGLPESRSPAGRRVSWILSGVGLCVLIALSLSITMLVQEQTGNVVIKGLNAGPEADARQWLNQNAQQAPTRSQAGDNIRILREGLSFISSHPSVAQSPAAQATVQRYSTLPPRPTRLLSPQEEEAYYEGAQDVYRLISSIAGQGGAAESMD